MADLGAIGYVHDIAGDAVVDAAPDGGLAFTPPERAEMPFATPRLVPLTDDDFVVIVGEPIDVVVVFVDEADVDEVVVV